MSLRLCIFGNSHIAALKEAHTESGVRWPGLDIRFVGAHEGLLLQTEITGGVLRPTSDAARDAFARLNRRTTVDLTAFDAFAITGAASAEAVLQVWRGMRTTALPSVAASADLMAELWTLVSTRLAVASTIEVLARRTGPRLAAMLRAASDRPLLLIPQPRPSARSLSGTEATTVSLRRATAAGDAPGVAGWMDAAGAALAARHGALYLPQPAPTLASPLSSRADLMHGGPRLTARMHERQPEGDLRHANAGYGALILDQIATALA